MPSGRDGEMLAKIKEEKHEKLPVLRRKLGVPGTLAWYDGNILVVYCIYIYTWAFKKVSNFCFSGENYVFDSND